jgi:single-strand DNA-binding protein
MLNRIVLIGRLTKDPDSQYTPTGVPVARFRLAVERNFRNQETGEKETDFIDVVAWRKLAEIVTQYYTKGRLVAVEGRLQMRSWVQQDGQRRVTYEVVADNSYALERSRESEPPGAISPTAVEDVEPGYTATSATMRRVTPSEPDETDLDDNDPFAEE